MAQEDTVTLTSSYESRVVQLRRAARHPARLAQGGARPRMQHALTELEDALSDRLGSLESAADADLADAGRVGRPSAPVKAGARRELPDAETFW
jgi:hypothetical protein